MSEEAKLLKELNEKMDQLNKNMEKMIFVLSKGSVSPLDAPPEIPSKASLYTGGDTASTVRAKIEEARREAQKKMKNIGI